MVDAASWSAYADVVAHANRRHGAEPRGYWSMSAIDVMSIGRPVLVPTRSGLGQEVGHDLCFAGENELEDKMVGLLVDPAPAEARPGRRAVGSLASSAPKRSPPVSRLCSIAPLRI